MDFFVSCAKSLEYPLVDELLALGCERATAAVAGVNVQGSLADAQRAVLWSRLASRVLWPIAAFDCADADALYAGAREVDWTEHLAPGMTLAVDAHVSGSAITHARYAAQRLKDAVVDVLRERTGARPDVDVQSPDVRLNLLVRKGRALLSVDLGGGPLHRRGWRGAQHEAPLKENLAALMLVRGQWASRYAGGGAVIDPMCGSGTLLIEAAMMAADVAPGLARLAGGDGKQEQLPTRWPGLDAAGWQAMLAEARERALVGRAALRPAFLGRDSDPRAIEAARSNARAAGMDDAIRFDVADIAQLGPDDVAGLGEGAGLVVSNPPYDARLAADPRLYRSLGEALQRAVPGWAACLLCGSEELAFATGLRARKRYTVFNGALECVLLLAEPVAAPAREPAQPRPLSDGAQMVANRLRKTLRASRRWREAEGVSCFRAYDADLPEYAAAVDVYAEADASERRWLHVQEYAAPAQIPEQDVRRRLNELLAAAREVFELPHERIALKTRSRGKGGSKYGRFDQRGEQLVVREGAVRLQVNLFDYLDTGLFLDHRPMRLRIAAEAPGTRFLNLFCYTGAATVHAAAAGAVRTTSVDLSATYLQWLAGNLRENGLGGPAHQLVQADAMQWLAADRGTYDLVFCDPPTFSNSARADDFDIQREHVRLLQLAVARLSPHGVLYFSNNFRRFRLDADAVAGFADCREISADTIPPDFSRNARIHRAWRLTRRH